MSYVVQTFNTRNREPEELASWLNAREAEHLYLVAAVGINWYIFVRSEDE